MLISARPKLYSASSALPIEDFCGINEVEIPSQYNGFQG